MPGGYAPPIFPGGGGDTGGGGGSGGSGSGSSGTNQDAQDFLRKTFEAFQNAQDAARRANEQRYNQGITGYGGAINQEDQRLANILGGYGGRLNQATDQFGQLLNRYDNRLGQAASQYGGALQGYGDLSNRVMGRLEGLGQSEAANIDERFARQQAQSDQDLISRGLGNTTVRSAVNRGIGLDKSRAQTELAENLSREKNTADLSTIGNLLGAQERFTGNLSDLYGQGIQAGERFVGAQSDLSGQGLQFAERANQQLYGGNKDLLDYMERRTDEYPSYETLVQLAAAIGQAGYGYGGGLPPVSPSPSPSGNIPKPNTSIFQPPPQPNNLLAYFQGV